MSTYKQNIPVVLNAVKPQSLASAASTIGTAGAILPAKARAFAVICQEGAHGGGNSTYQVKSCDDANGTNPVDVSGYSAVISAANGTAIIEVPVSAIPAGKYLAVVCTTTGTNLVSAVVVALDPNYPA